MTLREDIQAIVKGEVRDDEGTLKNFSRDASLFMVLPKIVVYPRDVDDVKTLVRFVRDRKKSMPELSLTARAAGTDMSGGALNESIIVAFTKYFTRIAFSGENSAEAEPGVYYRDFERATLARNLLLPPYPASRELCAIGGMVGNNAGGELTLEYGKVIDYVRALRVVFSDGEEYEVRPLSEAELTKKMRGKSFEAEVYRNMFALLTVHQTLVRDARPGVSKNSAGYNLWDVWNDEKKVFDLTKLLVGSQGTLGIVTGVTFSLVRPKKESQMLIVFLDRIDSLGELVKVVLQKKPTTFESYDDKTLKLAVRFAPEFITRLGIKNIFALIKNAIPEFFSILLHGFPRLVLQITFSGDDKESLRKKAHALAEELARFEPRYIEVVRDKREAEEYWLIRRESFNLLRNKVKGRKTAPFIDDFVVEPKHLSEFLPRLEKILREYPILYTIAGHMGNGNFHIIPLMKLEDEYERRSIPELADKVYELVLKYRGSITGEHNDGLIRSPYLKKMYGEKIYALFEQTKKIFDPLNIMNPRKKVGSSLDFALGHIRKD